MGRHKTPMTKGSHVLPTGSRLVASVAVAAAAAGALAAALVPAATAQPARAAAPAPAVAAAHAAAAPPAPEAKAAPAVPRKAAVVPATHTSPAAAATPQMKPAAAATPHEKPATTATPHEKPAAAAASRATRTRAAAPAGLRGDGAAAMSPAEQLRRAEALQQKLGSFSPSEVLSLVNEARKQAGSPPLRLDSRLQAQAEKAVGSMPDQPTKAGAVHGTQVQQPGATDAAAVNVSSNQVGAQAAVNGWLKDPAERANLLNPAFRTMGVAGSTKPAVIWWVQLFGK
ncbi:CAP domain-containing protein [Streptomyces sp. NPDC086023]|uniref:CAP domain-containing protein n=1 Tax=Streptomyces sp. NPDC086023 TaxID=3365746 RepID=UPI0037CF737B